MVMESENIADDRIVVGYFSNGADASRAVSELIDEGFQVAEIGAAFRTARGSMAVTDGGLAKGNNANPAVSGSLGGVASHDEAVTPAGLAPGSGNAFPAPSRPGPIPGSETPSTLRHDLPRDLPSTLRHDADLAAGREAAVTQAARSERRESDEVRRERMRNLFGDDREMASPKRSSTMKFGTGEGHLFPDYEYSESSFENSFLGMGLGAREARGLSGELTRGGAVLSVTPGSRASLAEGILQRNHGRVRFESMTARSETPEGSRVEIYGRMRNYYRPEEGIQRKAS